MSDGFPEQLLKFAVPKAAENEAAIVARMGGRRGGSPVAAESRQGQVDDPYIPKLQTAPKGTSPYGAASGSTSPEAPAPQDPGGDLSFEDEDDYDGMSAVPETMVQRPVKTQPVVPNRPVEMETPRKQDPLVRITIELADGSTIMVPVSFVVESTYSVYVFIPMRDDITMFTPKVGAQIKLTHDGKTYQLYYPGAFANVDKLGYIILTFIKAGAE